MVIMMLFNIETSTFAPDYLVTDNQNWVEVSAEEIDGISASITCLLYTSPSPRD